MVGISELDDAVFHQISQHRVLHDWVDAVSVLVRQYASMSFLQTQRAWLVSMFVYMDTASAVKMCAPAGSGGMVVTFSLNL